jgi:hypothetical protein
VNGGSKNHSSLISSGLWSIAYGLCSEVSAISYAQCAISELGGADRDRTDDLRLAKPALSQLSYSPDNAPDQIAQLIFD